jgi:hypothetical protein
VNVNYVGVSNENPSPILTAAGQTAQDGFNGYTINEIAANLASEETVYSTIDDYGGYWLTGGGGTGRSAQTANIILLQIGANDIIGDVDPAFTGTPGTESATQFAADETTRLEALINEIMYYEPNATLLVDGTSPLLNYATLSYDYDMDVENLVATQYKGTNIHYVDMWDGLIDNGKEPGYVYYGGDGVHLNSEGYTQMGQVWGDAIMEYYDFDGADVPEPSTWALLLIGALALLGWAKTTRRNRTMS